MADEQMAQAIRTLGQQQVKILTGTVSGYSPDPQATPVRLDSANSLSTVNAPIIIPSLVGVLPVNTRVSIILAPPAGMLIVGVIDAPYNLTALWDYFLVFSNNPVWVIRRLYTSNDTWNKPTSTLFLGVNVKIQSGGGGSGGTSACNAQTSGSAGGKGGGYVEGYTLSSFLDATAAITVGAGGTAGAAGNNAGGTGGTSSFNSGGGATVLSIPGGAGGAGGGSAAAGQTTQKGGDTSQTVTATNFDVVDVRQGDDGGTGYRAGTGDTGYIMPGVGGGSRMGAATGIATLITDDGGGGPILNKQIPPVAGWPFGGGASGRGVNDYAGGGTVAAAGGAAGGQGLVVVEEWYRT